MPLGKLLPLLTRTESPDGRTDRYAPMSERIGWFSRLASFVLLDTMEKPLIVAERSGNLLLVNTAQGNSWKLMDTRQFKG